jgi:hypothetical protein
LRGTAPDATLATSWWISTNAIDGSANASSHSARASAVATPRRVQAACVQ